MWDAIQSFLAAYGLWIVLGLLFLAMMRGHGGGGCGMGHTHTAGQAPSRDASGGAHRTDTSEPTTGPANRSGGCH